MDRRYTMTYTPRLVHYAYDPDLPGELEDDGGADDAGDGGAHARPLGAHTRQLSQLTLALFVGYAGWHQDVNDVKMAQVEPKSGRVSSPAVHCFSTRHTPSSVSAVREGPRHSRVGSRE